MATEKFQYLAGTLIPGTKYRVIRLLGAGGMGTVYEVEDTTIDKRYVLKTLHANLSSRKDLVERMQREAKALAKLEHRNIVQVITADVTGDSLKLPYFVMQKLHGHTLRTVLDHKGRLEIDAAVRLIIDLLNALYHAHENGIVHRDVKPENIFLHRDPDGLTVPKLLDFGVMATTESVTITGHRFIGTLRYAAPEQLMGEKVSPQTDLYAAALVLYEALAGRGPFEEEGEAMKVARAHIEKVPPLLSMYRPVPPSLERMIMRSLSKTPAERHPDAFTFAAELHRFLRELRGSLPPDQATASTVSDVMQLPAAPILGEAVRGLARIAPSPAAGQPASKASSGSASTRPDAPIAGATLPASDPITAPLRPVGAGHTPPGAPGAASPPPAALAAPSVAPRPEPVAFARGATVAQDPPAMTLGEERPALRAIAAQEAAQRDAAARGLPGAAIDRNAPTGTLAPLANVRDGETELIDSMIGEGLAHAGTPPARNVKRISTPGPDADGGTSAAGANADADAANAPASTRADHATSAAGGSSHTVSQAPSVTSPSRGGGGGRMFVLAMGAVIAVALLGAAALVYASRLPHPAAVEPAVVTPAPMPSPSPSSAPSPSATESPSLPQPSATASPPLARPSASAEPSPLPSAEAPRVRPARISSPSPSPSPAAAASLPARPSFPAETSSSTAKPAPSANPILRRKLPGSGL